ncbi:hypothetical protein B0H63DRAFT_117649 [Podospora didyma]|uniref:Uncharacterized protein n=1 Tax=Podospora didyma TaxID=330526 RepID=A0AAE0NZE1_9PEZI|nr:hypothetical protein B0H63DRAFT_117649 [Podospora didyma]
MGRVVRIPPSFQWLLPAQGFVAAVIIYSTIYVFKAGLHFVLGLYFCFSQKWPGSYHLFIVPPWLVAAAGIWCCCVYYFTKQVELILSLPNGVWRAADGTEQPEVGTWSKVGLATSALDVFIDLALLAIFILGYLRDAPQPNQQSSAYTPVSTAPPATTQYQYQQQQQPQQYQQQYPQQYQLQQQQQYQQPQQYQAPALDYKNSTPTPPTVLPLPSPPPPPPPALDPPPAIGTTTPRQGTPTQSYDRNNRIDVIKRLCALQHPDGHWDYTIELAEVVRMWGGGRELTLHAAQHGVTAVTHACLLDLCNYVWGAQRDRREQTALSPGELNSLQAVKWDIGWANHALERATAWMGGFR